MSTLVMPKEIKLMGIKRNYQIANWESGEPTMYWVRAQSVRQYGKAKQLTLEEGKTTWVNEDTERHGRIFLLPDWKIANENLYEFVVTGIITGAMWR